jgi:chromosome segregation ATPase
MSEKGFTHRLIEMEGDLESLKESQSRIESKIDEGNKATRKGISHQVKPANISGWIGAAATTLAVIGALAMTIITPIQNDVQYLKETIENKSNVGQQQLFTLGQQTAELKELNAEIAEIKKNLSSDEVDLKDLEVRLRNLSEKLAVLVQRIESNEQRFEGILQQRITFVDANLGKLSNQIQEMWERFKDLHSPPPK